MYTGSLNRGWTLNLFPGRAFSFSSHVLPGVLALLDTAVILTVALTSFAWLVGSYAEDPDYYAAAIAFVWLVTIMLHNFGGLYQLEAIMRPFAFIDRITIAFATTFLFLFAAAFALKVSTTFSRVWMATFACGAFAGVMVSRVLASYVVGRLADRRVFTRNVVIAGAGEQSKRLLAHIEAAPPRFVSVLGVFAEALEGGCPGSHRMLGTFDDLTAYIRANKVDDVIVALPWSADAQIMSLMALLRELPVNVYLGSDLVGFRVPFRQAPDHFGSMPMVEVMGRPLAGWDSLVKVVLDFSLGILVLLLSLPLMALIAIAIKLDSKGPVFFRQERYGVVNKVFRIWKFRTMSHAAASAEKNLQATRNDPRVTRVGRFLRRTSLDELPQIFNVLNGTMSLVGPRPHAVDHNEKYSEEIRGYFARHRVKPGITGWAQVNGLRGETQAVELMAARVKCDIYYAENWSLLFDLRILAMTFFVILIGRNAY